MKKNRSLSSPTVLTNKEMPVFKRNKVHPSFSPSFSKYGKQRRNLKREKRETIENRLKYGLQRSTKLLIEITNGKSAKMGKSPAPSPRRGGTPERESSEEDETPPSSPQKKDQSIEIPEITSVHEQDYPPEQPPNPPPKNELFDRISVKASKFLPKKKNFGKFFGEKESDIRIYTIDREMQRKRVKPRSFDDTFTNIELTNQLQKTRQDVQTNENAMFKTVGCLASPFPPYRLFFLPPEDWNDPDCLLSSILKILLCQCTLACLILIWIIFGALTFYMTEGPYEFAKMSEFQSRENSLIMSLATDLRLLNQEEPIWKDTIKKYTYMHKNIVLEGVLNSYGLQKIYWTFAGSVMFATSLLTTLGLATPFPLTTAGGVEAFVFVLIGVPIHFLFLTHLGRTIALKTQLFSKEIENKFSDLRRRIINVRRFGEDLKTEKEIWPDKMFMIDFKPPSWLRFFPLISTGFYYAIGVLIFGLAREMEFPRILFFSLDFARCDASTSGIARMGYAWYLEGGAILTFINIALLKESNFNGLIPAGIKYGFMTNSLE